MKKKTSPEGAKKKSKGVKKAVAKKVLKAKKMASKKGTREGKKTKKENTHKRLPLLERTFAAKEDVKYHEWKLFDATNQTLGRLSTQVATYLMGKHKPIFTRGADVGDFVIVINADKIVLTGNKWDSKLYQHHTGYPGGIKTYTAKEMVARRPESLVEEAVWRMLPKNKGHLCRKWFKKLKIFAGSEHPHAAQKPQAVQLNG